MLEEDDFESWKIRMERYIRGLPRRIFNILNRTSTAKEIWDSLELLMKGSGKTLERQKEDMFDEYERLRANGNESI
uniref:Retrovirus-related Pol polyprotein from transposon TNT 1-94 n=1 Tax=Tanacetum cinerariifolium TaxID=118510 RepID=A0A699UNH4_TANCI|nr:hypothetical protein [Tanacetum cinerariifolium]